MSDRHDNPGGTLDSRAGLAGKTALVVGGGSGIGAAVSLALAENGVHLAICDKNSDALNQTLSRANDYGIRVFSRKVDVLQTADFDQFLTAVSAWTQELDIIVNIAGGTRQRSFVGSTRDQDIEDIRLNYGYLLDAIRWGAPLMKHSDGGSIINFTTIEAHRGAAGFATYAGAKAATTNLSRCLAVELGPEGIRVNCIAPDTTPSEGNNEALPENKRDAMAALAPAAASLGLKMYIPMKRAPDTESLANAVLFLASDLSAFTTGTTLHVDGGTWAASGFIDWPEGDGFLPVPLAGTLNKLGD